MFARNVNLQLKPNTATQFTQTLEKEVLPLLRKQPGFRGGDRFHRLQRERGLRDQLLGVEGQG